MRSKDNVEEAIKKKLSFTASPELHDRILNDVLNAQEKSKKTKSAATKPKIRRQIMKSPITKLAAAAVVIIAVTLAIHIWDKSIPLAYAIEQTIEANNNVRYLHIKIYAADEKEPREAWLEFDRDGQVTKVRINLPAWFFPTDGARVIVWKEDIEQVWDKSKNILGTMKANKNTKEQLTAFLREVDPRLAVKHIYELESQDKVKVEIAEPSDKTEPITMRLFLMSASQLQQQFGRVKFLRIVSIGPAVPNPELETKGFNVPCTIEIEENGKRITPTLEGIKVQQLRNQPSRWVIVSLGD